jgi:hypothetical protein
LVVRQYTRKSVTALARSGQFDRARLAQAVRDLGLNPDAADPATA